MQHVVQSVVPEYRSCQLDRLPPRTSRQRTVLRWVQTFGPLVASGARKHRRRPGRRWWVDEVFLFRNKGQEKRYLYRAIDDQGQVMDVLFREHRDTAVATLGTQLRRIG